MADLRNIVVSKAGNKWEIDLESSEDGQTWTPRTIVLPDALDTLSSSEQRSALFDVAQTLNNYLALW
jgi:hypothetical protein